jgi:hypothetical protein
VTDDAAIDEALADGFVLEERVVGSAWCWGFVRCDDDRWPVYRERRHAISWMADRLHRIAVFRLGGVRFDGVKHALPR